jgi:hypothetical protein
MLPLIAVALALVAAALALGWWGRRRWRRATDALLNQLAAAHATVHPGVVDLREADTLPAPVQRYLRAVLRHGQPMVAGVRLAHTGTFNMKTDGDGWKPFTSVQQVTLQPPGFVWDARISLAPGLPVHVHDAYVAGAGVLHAAVLGLMPMARLRGGGELAEGELMRWLAEAAWCPTALLPSQGVRWQAVDARSADATLSDGAVSATLRFHFDGDGLVDTVTAAARGRLVGGVSKPTPWQGRFWNYALRDGLRVPLQGEVAWLLPGGASPYWRGRITALEYATSS